MTDTENNDMKRPAMHKHPATGERLSVRVDGDWMTRAAEYGPVLVFWRSDEWDHLDEGRQIDVTKDNVCWVPEQSTPNPLEEYLDEGGVTSYLAPNEYEISNVEVHDVTVSEAHQAFTNHPTNADADQPEGE